MSGSACIKVQYLNIVDVEAKVRREHVADEEYAVVGPHTVADDQGPADAPVCVLRGDCEDFVQAVAHPDGGLPVPAEDSDVVRVAVAAEGAPQLAVHVRRGTEHAV